MSETSSAVASMWILPRKMGRMWAEPMRLFWEDSWWSRIAPSSDSGWERSMAPASVSVGVALGGASSAMVGVLYEDG